ncbi:MAG: S8 family serine peptidase, partial [Bdellovibrionales bacterium]|nr:S8 family serine peptidase [Bdellovibrionales bacterium]
MQKLKNFIVAFVLLQMTIITQNAMAADLEHEAVPGEYIVKLKDNVDLNSFIMSSGENQSASIVLKDQNLVKITRPSVEVASFTMEEIQNSPYVEYVEPNYIYRINKLPNDPELPKLWGLINTGDNNPNGSKGVAGVDIDAERAWEIQTGSRDVVVAVIDTGVDHTLADLQANMWTNDAELNGEPGVDDDNNGYVDDIYGYDFVNDDGDPKDDHGHGSHVAGTIGATGNDGKGLVGVAWNVRMMGLKFLSKSGGGSLED